MDIDPKIINDICGTCGAPSVGDSNKIICTACGLETHNPTPPVEDLSNICPHCRHPLAPEHDDFGCHIEGCHCTHTTASTVDKIQDTLANNDEKFDKVMSEFKAGTLVSGSGAKVTSEDQAKAIAIAESKSESKNSVSDADAHDVWYSALTYVLEDILKDLNLPTALAYGDWGKIPSNYRSKILPYLRMGMMKNATGFKAAEEAFASHGETCSTCDAECRQKNPDADKLCATGLKLLFADIENKNMIPVEEAKKKLAWIKSEPLGAAVDSIRYEGKDYTVSDLEAIAAGENKNGLDWDMLGGLYEKFDTLPMDKAQELMDIVHRADDNAIREVAGKSIKFVSKLAQNEALRRGLKNALSKWYYDARIVDASGETKLLQSSVQASSRDEAIRLASEEVKAKGAKSITQIWVAQPNISNAEGNKTTAGKTIDEVSRDMTGKAYSALPDDGPEQDAVMRLFEEEGGVAQQAFQNAEDSPAMKEARFKVARFRSREEAIGGYKEGSPESTALMAALKELLDLQKKERGESGLSNAEDKEPLTDKMMKDMMPLFVEAVKYPGDDHKCGNCNMRTPSGQCTVVEVDIDREKGTCLYWAGGDSAEDSDLHQERMKQDTAGYIIAQGKVQCGTCQHFKDDMCLLWDGKVIAKECCISWSSGQESLNNAVDPHSMLVMAAKTLRANGVSRKAAGEALRTRFYGKVTPGDVQVALGDPDAYGSATNQNASDWDNWSAISGDDRRSMLQKLGVKDGVDISYYYWKDVPADVQAKVKAYLRENTNVEVDPEDLAEIARHAEGVEHEVAEAIGGDKGLSNNTLITSYQREAEGAIRYGSR